MSNNDFKKKNKKNQLTETYTIPIASIDGSIINGKDNTPHLHLYNIPAEKYIKENMVIQMDFNNIDDVLNLLNNKTEKRIL